jgi:DNA-binding transcriptional ArsR family regulator
MADESRCSLREWLACVPDPRSRLGRWQPLVFVLALAVCAFTAAGHDSPEAIAEWAACCSQARLAALAGRRDPWAGRSRPPSVRTFARIFGRIAAEAFNAAVCGYLAALSASIPDPTVRCSVLTEQRTAGILLTVDTEDLLLDALAQLGVQTRQVVGVPDQGIDLVIEPGETRVQVKHRVLVTDEVARRLLIETPRPPDSVLLVVGDRVTEIARRLLIEHRAGYYDLRGHLALRAANIVIDADVEPVSGRAERTHALSGNAGLQVAAALLTEPAAGASVRELARRLGRSPSTVSEVLAALRRAGLVDDRHRVEDTQLFWQVADRWPAARVHLARLPIPDDASITKPLRLGLDDAENTIGWALTDSAAAVAYGAPLAVRTGQLVDFYVPDQATVRRATALLGAASSRTQARCAVRVAPVPEACSRRVDLATNPFEWPLAHPLFVALDLAQDSGRGREILGAWTPPERWARVW